MGRPNGWAVDAVVVSDIAEGADQMAVWTHPEDWAVDAISAVSARQLQKGFREIRSR
jgi:hypothetical protein